MFRIDIASAVGSLPTPAVAGTPAYFTDGNPGTGAPPTILPADWCNRVQEELMSFLTAASLSPSKTTYDQVAKAIQSGLLNYIADASGSANTVQVTLPINPPSLNDGLLIRTKIAHDNTGPSVLVLAPFASKPITLQGNALAGGELKGGQIAEFAYDTGTASFQVVSTNAVAYAARGSNSDITALTALTSLGTTSIAGGQLDLITLIASSFGLRVRRDSGDTSARIQFTNFVGNSEIGSIAIDASGNMTLNCAGLLALPAAATVPTQSALTGGTKVASCAYADASATAAVLVAAGGVGAYAMNSFAAGAGPALTVGSTYSAAAAGLSGFSGTWRCMSSSVDGGWGGNSNAQLLQRIS